MSDTATPTADTSLFSAVDREEFDAADVQAGKAIGQMLSILFLYTVFAMALVTWWTMQAERDGGETPTEVATPHPAH